MAATSATDLASARPAAPAGTTAVPGPRVRDPRLDFYRGIAMFIILFAHTPGNFFTSWIPARWGFSDATEIFVFCSGMASAIAFGGSFDRAGWRLGTARVSFRCWQVYWAHIGMFFTIAMLMAVLNEVSPVDKNYVGSLNLWKFFADPGPQLIGLFTLTYVPNYFDILPMYLAILAMMPIVMILARIHVGAVFVFMGFVWLAAQGRILEPMGLMSLNFPAEPWSAREWFFNPFGWQLIFFTGFAFMRGWLPRPPVKAWLIGLCALIVLANVPLSNIGVRELGFDWARDWRIANQWLITKSDFGILRYVHFLALGYLAWVAAGEGGRRLIAHGQTTLSRVWGFIVAQITKVGQQSLAVFVFSMVFARLVGATLDAVGRTGFTVTALNLLGCAMLITVAYGAGWYKGQPWRKRLTAAAQVAA
ncbi:MAG: OpgC domain-containing protein [Pseudomonadota bacterium]